MIERAARLKVVGRAGTGVDNVDVEAATRRGIVVVNAAGSNALSAAEHAIALLLAQARNIPQAHSSLVQGRWERSRFGGVEVTGKTLGVLGFGRIGQMVAERAKGLGMRVVAYDPFVAEARYRELGVEKAASARGPLPARATSSACTWPRRPRRAGFVGREAFAAMKPGARLINAARGDVVDQEALVEALESGHLGGAGHRRLPAGARHREPALRHAGRGRDAPPGGLDRGGPGPRRRRRRRAGGGGPHRRRGHLGGQHPRPGARGARGARALPAAGAPARPARGGARRRRGVAAGDLLRGPARHPRHAPAHLGRARRRAAGARGGVRQRGQRRLARRRARHRVDRDHHAAGARLHQPPVAARGRRRA